MIGVTFQHPTTYFDNSYGINSANAGPYGDCLMNELIPYVEKNFRVIPAVLRASANRLFDRRLEFIRAASLPPRVFRWSVDFLPRSGRLPPVLGSCQSLRRLECLYNRVRTEVVGAGTLLFSQQ